MIRTFKKFYRLAQINFILAKHGLDNVVLSIPMFAPIQFLAYFNPWNWYATKKRSRGVRIREAFEELGPIFVKFGQGLSSRRDLLPEDIADELAKLQDRVTPFPGAQARTMLEEIFQQPLENVFLEFEETPLASASIAQVHGARLFNGNAVVIKLLRPGIEKCICQDVALMQMLARLIERYCPRSRRFKPKTLVANFEKQLHYELDLQQEAANAAQLRRNFKHSTIFYVPEVYWNYTYTRAMTLERIEGIPIAQIETLKQNNVNLKKLAENIVEIFFTQVFRDCFFHADMHPGNIFVDASDPKNPRCLAVDFGIMGSLNASDRRYLAENLMAFFRRDYHLVAKLHLQSGWIPPQTSVEDFEMAIRSVCEPIFDRPLKDISFGQLLLRLFQTGQRFNMEVLPQLVLLQKTLISIEGLSRYLYPDLDLWETARPCVEKWLKEQMSLGTMLRKFKYQLPYWLEKLPDMPDMLYEILQRSPRNFVVPSAGASVVQSTRRGLFFLLGFVVGISILAILYMTKHII
jgi:ubiquinone biosynthesis protein